MFKVLRLMGTCNSKCTFCMVEDEIAASDHPPLEALLPQLADLGPGDEIDLFGGEPTLYPQFFELLAEAARRGLRIYLATNARTFSSETFTRRVAAVPNVYIRTSLYGADAATHDALTRRVHCFDQTIRGFRNIRSASLPIAVNIVMLEENRTQLLAMTRLLFDVGITRLSYASVILGGHIRGSVPRMDDLRPSLREAVAFCAAHGMTYAIEKSPLCLLPEQLNCYLPEDEPVMMGSCERIFTHVGECEPCILKGACHGVDRSYLAIHGPSDLQPFVDDTLVPVRTLTVDQLSAFDQAHRSEFVRLDVPPEALSIETFIKVARLKSSLPAGVHLLP